MSIKFCEYQDGDCKCLAHLYPLFKVNDAILCPYKIIDIMTGYKMIKGPDDVPSPINTFFIKTCPDFAPVSNLEKILMDEVMNKWQQ